MKNRLMNWLRALKFFPKALRFFVQTYMYPLDKKRYGFCGENVTLHAPIIFMNTKNIYLEDHVNIFGRATLIISKKGKFVIKKYSGAAQGLTVVTGNHTTHPTLGKWHKEVIVDDSTDHDTDVIVEEDVWLAANVTLLPGSRIGRGAIVGAGSVCRSFVPPYSIVMGNPAKVVGFKFTPDEILEHERQLYPESERYSRKYLEDNYQKYFQKRLKQITEFIK